MASHSHRFELSAVCLLLATACNSPAPSDTNGVNMQPTGAGNAAAGNQAGSATGSAVGPGATAGGGVSAGAGRTGASSGSAGVGSAGTGNASMSAAGAAAASSGTDNALDKGNVFQSGEWQGYVWTAAEGAGSTIDPMDFSAQTTGMPRCVKGSVAATSDYSGVAILGFNLNEGPNSPAAGVVPTKAGVKVDVTNNGGSPLRFQVKSTSGGTETTWCASLSGSGGFIAWSDLNTKCWDGTGMAYNNEPLTAAMVLVPGTTDAAVTFDFCVNGIAEADGPVGGATAGSGAAGMGAAGVGAAGSAAAGGGAAGSMSTDPTQYPRLQGGCDGFATRYWDCCKPHCGWSSNVNGSAPLATCDRSDNSLGGNYDAANSCEGGPAYLCHSMAPWAVNDQLAYGYAAVAASGDICGKCFQLDFSGSSHNAGNDPGAAALAGKTMIVQAINIGGDVGSGQFDISIPGGGVGAFNACSTQWGVSAAELGPNYGGFLASCKQQGNASDQQALKNCVMQKCASVFEAKGFTQLMDGCRWYVDWFQAADNPALKYAEVACPSELMNKGLQRSGSPSNACLR